MRVHLLRWLVGGVALAALGLLSSGCGKKPAPKTDPPPEEVTVVAPLAKEIVDHEEFTGWTQAEKTTDLKPSHVTGYIIPRADYQQLRPDFPLKDVAPAPIRLKNGEIKEGTDVGKGQELFYIDPKTYMAEVNKAEASVKLARATYKTAQSNLTRAMAAGSASTPEEKTRLSNLLEEASASIKVAETSLAAAKLNLDYTIIRAPYAGRISRRYVDPGNIAKSDDTVITTIVSLDPIHAYFDVDERTVLRLRRLVMSKLIPSARDTKRVVHIALADEEEFKHEGTIDFINNRLDIGTGSLSLRAELKNPTPKDGKTPLFSPGMFIRVRVPIGDPHAALLVPEKALGSDQGERYVFVVEEGNDDEGKPVSIARRCDVKVGHSEKHKLPDSDGRMRDEVYRVVTPAKGDDSRVKLTAKSRIIVDGIQKVSDGSKVKAAPLGKKPAVDAK